MKDTTPEIERMMHRKLMALSAEERFIRGALMFDAAREMVLASFGPAVRGMALKRKLFERFYGRPLPVPSDR